MNRFAKASASQILRADSVAAALGLCDQAGIEFVATIDGFSMTPGLSPGTSVRLRRVDPRTLRVADVIAFEHNSRLIAHRVVRCGRTRASRRYLLTRGDARLLNDVPVRDDFIVGVVTAKRIDADWAPLDPALPRGSKYVLAGMFTALSGGLLDLNPRWAAHFIRWAWRSWTLVSGLRCMLLSRE